MATLSIIRVTPSNHVLRNGDSIVIQFTRADTGSDKVRVRLRAQGQSAVVMDATSYTEFTSGTCTTTLTTSVLATQMGMTEKVSYSLDITCFDTVPAVLDWTSATTFTMYSMPAILNLSPAAGSTMDGYPLTVSWQVNPNGADNVMASQRLTVFDGTSQSYVYDQQVEPTTRTVTLGLDDVQLFSGRTYYVAIECVNDVGFSSRAENNFSTYWEPPLEPSATVEIDEASLSAAITVHAGEDVSDWLIKFVGTDAVVRDGYLTIEGTDAVINAEYTVTDGNMQFESPSAPATQSLMLVRVNADGSRFVIATGLQSGDTVKDPLPPLDATYSYEVTATDSNGSTSVSLISMTIETKCWVVSFGTSADDSVLIRYGQRLSRNPTRGGELLHFADGGVGGGLPVFYPTTDRDESISFEFWLMSASDVDRLIDLCQRHGVGWLRDQYGHRWRGVMTPQADYDCWGITFKCSVNMSVVRFEEAQ